MNQPTNLAIYQGDTYAATVTVLNADGTPADLTGYTAASQIRTGPADEACQVAAEFDCIVQANLIFLTLSSDQTTLLSDLDYYWDLQINSADGLITVTLLAGQVSVTLEVTREPVDGVFMPVGLVEVVLPRRRR